MRVLLWELPVWMTEIIEPAIAAESRLRMVQAPARMPSVRDAVAYTQPDVLVTGSGDRGEPCRGFATLLFEFPALRVFSIGGGGLDSVQVTMMPTEDSLGDISLEALVRTIVQGTEVGAIAHPQPTRHVDSG
jgi:hypothetical protein